MVFIVILGFLINPKDVLSFLAGGMVFGLAIWLPWSIIVDYISLFKTRVILDIIARMKLRHLVAITILVLDFIGYIILYLVGIIVVANSMAAIRDLRSLAKLPILYRWWLD
jgi:hypothetical protein